MTKRNPASFSPMHAELTLHEAADLMNVSRPYLALLLERKEIPLCKVGRKQRILVRDLMEYKAKIDRARLGTLDELTEEAQNLGLGY